MAPVTMILRIIIILYVTSSLKMQSLSHAQTVSEEMLGVNTWHTTLPPYMDETGNNLKQEQQSNWKSFKFLISIKINASRQMVQDRLRTLLKGYSFPYSVSQNVIITNVNLNTTQPLKLFKYITDIKINAPRGAMIDQLRDLIHKQKYPVCIKKTLKISAVNITTVCVSNSNKSCCKCENQYVWPSEQCSKHGVCGPNHNDTCRCITSLPSDGPFCRRPPAPLKSLKYTIDIKFNASRDVVIERLRALIHGQKFPTCVKKGMKISGANITTVCLSNVNKTQCKCENQYVWSSEQCSKHGVCGPNHNDTCRCIASLPTDGAFCQRSHAPLKSFKYTIDIKFNASRDTVIERLRGLIHGQKFPTCVKKGMKISGANITTVCLSNVNKTQCKCENQYVWSSEQCSKHRVCGSNHHDTCRCIASLPTDGPFCRRPPAPLKLFKYTFDLKFNASRDTVIERLRALFHEQKFPTCVKKGMKISAVNITTVCLSNVNKTQCKCENQYVWSSEQCSKHGVCGPNHNDTCRCIASLPSDGAFCRRPPGLLKLFKYTIDVKINASSDAVIECLRTLIHGQKFPTCVKKGIKISGANITTVCLSNVNKTQCKCENQYVWPSEQCTKHGVCGPNYNDTCRCIASLPTDGPFCRRRPVFAAPLKSFKYTIDIKFNASRDVVIESLRALIHGQKFPTCVQKGMKISGTNITTVCLSNVNKTQCKCENQYVWPPEQCSKHGVCGPNHNDTCRCIPSLPTDGPFCQRPPAPLKLLKYTINMKINASSDTVIERLRALIHGQKFPTCVKKGMKISGVNITTVCLSNVNKTQCKCENQYVWSSEQCSKHGVCGPNHNDTCRCITSLPSDGPFCRRPLEPPTTMAAPTITAATTTLAPTTTAELTTTTLATTTTAELTTTTQATTTAPPTTTLEPTATAAPTTTTLAPTTMRAPTTTTALTTATLTPTTTTALTTTLIPTTTTMAPTTTSVAPTTRLAPTISVAPTTLAPTTTKATTPTTTKAAPTTPTTTKATPTTTLATTTPKPTTKPKPPTTTPKPATTPKTVTTRKPTTTPKTETTRKPTTKPITVTTLKPTTMSELVNREMSLAIDETYDASLNNRNSDKFKKYKADIEEAIHNSYKNVKGFISATVTGFRPGSVIVEFFIKSSEEIKTSEEISQAVYTNMIALNFNVDPLSVAKTDKIDMRKRDTVFPEQKMTLSCPDINRIGNIDWRFQGEKIQPSSLYSFTPDRLNLTVKSVNISNNGRYECLYNTSTGPQIVWDRIDYIKPYPSMQVPNNKAYKCENREVTLDCCVHSDYSVQWVQSIKSSKIDLLTCRTEQFKITAESSCAKTFIYTCKLDNEDLSGFSYSSKSVELVVHKPIEQSPDSPVTCNNDIYGFGKVGDKVVGDCVKEKVGFREGECRSDGFWVTVKDTCVLRIIEQLQQESQGLDAETLTDFVDKLNNATINNEGEIVQSEATVSAMVEILNNIADVTQTVMLDEVVITNFLSIVDVISSETVKPVWEQLNSNGESQGNSSQLLNAIESVIKATSNSNFNITSPTNSFLFKKVTTSEDFNEVLKLNSTAAINIPGIASSHKNVTITAVAFSSLGNVMSARNRTDDLNTTENVINGLIVVVNTSISIKNIQLNFEKLRDSVTLNNNSVNLWNPQCVFWEFNLFNRTGGWDSTGCEVIQVNGNVTSL
uniref:Uncharacterized protein n=1 Tax=Cyprinus carpio carpio TaxID=630221 RepID=A0A9J7ZN06_CYPCA